MGFGSFVLGNAQRPSERSGRDPTRHGTEKDMELHLDCLGSRGVKRWLRAAEKKWSMRPSSKRCRGADCGQPRD